MENTQTETEAASVASEANESTWGEETPAVDTTAVDENGGRTVTVKVRGKNVSVTYDMRELTPRLLRKLESGDGSLTTAKEYVETLVTAWTLTDKRGKPIDLAAEDAFDSVSFGALDAIAAAILGDTAPK